ncbi:LysM peptidoglycan-binding domain-containing protein [Alkalihalobacillus sp. LMS39]|uniref:LysM peptidoglycan-binding domain-containing protein n=1 Tax=Alkalihalobacillus sp. LMS39 TaxID=2924032 RepID=UPI001FB23A53|nr:LysM peptidoglycan-binding domain-containing protein [Alkalihalobacillus sp. LMS39]UOE94027.1 LysM peptidoglycan-binding domain-containing protein [Alkalihalobacillus sp. LMS39]
MVHGSRLQVYCVREGDTLLGISSFFHIPYQDLLLVNPYISFEDLQVGQLIYLPLSFYNPYCQENAIRYTLRAGESLSNIAEKYDSSYETILQTNRNLHPYRLFEGQVWCIPVHWDVYESQTENVSFVYPGLWEEKKVEKGIHLEGEYGFVDVKKVYSKTLSVLDIGQHYAFKSKARFGSKPLIEQIHVQNEVGYIILPSTDQKKTVGNEAALVLSYPSQGIEDSFTYLVLVTNQEFIYSITRSLQFNIKA